MQCAPTTDTRSIARISEGIRLLLQFHVITLFPELIETYCASSIIGRGIKAGKIAVSTYNPRDFCQDKYRKVDDTPYGGGAGMVLMPGPIFDAFESIKRPANSPVVLMTPQGTPLKQSMCQDFSTSTDIVLINGHYEGFDERICTLATHEISIGDFVITGGELASLIVIDAIGRLIPGVLGKSISLADESFVSGLLEATQYTKPPEFRGMVVPEVLRSGDHQAIARWRKEQALKRTYLRRPDLLETTSLDDEDKKILRRIKTELDNDTGACNAPLQNSEKDR
jgi:tRNA (guanine37-N1)-methyltransferase